ncbi:uncharacterized protein LOC135122731 isoform X1 [Zophobas morio]|uniref:uncharacterized protein LOC135122731 isoform X1 n=1 Tax=Zophobas morio TaxID=2755281 RepID=UPI0030835E16
MNTDGNKEYSVNWKNHMSHVRKAFDHLLNSNELTDVTLCCEGKKIGAHKMLLSACSGYFRDTFKEVPCQHPVIILYGVEYSILSDILRFIYNGEVSVDTAKLDSFLKIAQLLQISGLTDDPSDSKVEPSGVEHSDSTVSNLGIEETFVEPTTSTSKAVKRVRTKEVEGPQYKILKQDEDPVRQNDTVLISDVKCEPSELVTFEDPLEDPLQSDHSYDGRQLYGFATDQNAAEEDMKIDVDENWRFERFGEEAHPAQKLIPKSTVRTKSCIWSAFKAFCEHRKYTLDQSSSTEQISEILADWGLNMRKANGSDYKEGVVKTIWNTTAKMIQEMFYDKYKIKFDPFRDIEFKKARDSRDIKRRQLRCCPEKRKASSIIFTEDERYKIYTLWDENTPSGLQRKFFHIAGFELAWKGREAADCLTYYFKQEFDQSGVFTGRIEYNPTFSRTSNESGSNESRWLVANRTDPNICPIRLLLTLLDKRTSYSSINTDRLFLTPNPNWNKSETSAWYKDCPVGKNQISTWTKEAAEKIGIDTKIARISNRSNYPTTSKFI